MFNRFLDYVWHKEAKLITFLNKNWSYITGKIGYEVVFSRRLLAKQKKTRESIYAYFANKEYAVRKPITITLIDKGFSDEELEKCIAPIYTIKEIEMGEPKIFKDAK